MLTLSVLWVLLAASVTVIAMLRKAPPAGPANDSPKLESGSGIAVLALLYGVALLAGFLYISKFLVSSL